MRVVRDEDVMRHLPPVEAVSVMERVFAARARGDYAGHPRWNMPFKAGRSRFVVTPGSVEDAVGARIYLAGDYEADDQLTAVWDAHTGGLKGLVIGGLLGATRTGAIGGVAVKHLARFEAVSLAVIGTGRQAFTQVRSILAGRIAINELRVYSRTPAHRDAFCQDMGDILPRRVQILPCDDAETAVREADIVVGATNSRQPVIFGDWLKPGAHVSVLGPKYQEGAEIDLKVLERADFIATDSPEQVAAYQHGGFLGRDIGKPLYDLAAVIAQQAGRPAEDAITVFVSAGLAGTEVALANHLLDKLAGIDH